MRGLLLLLAIGATICSAAVLPPLHSKSLRQRSALRELYQSKKQAARRSVQSCGITVPLSLADSGFCGNISIGSQSEPVLTLFDLRASQLSALSPDLEFCSSSGDCSPVNSNINSYNPNHSDSATNLTETFVITVSNSTFSGVLYEDSVVLGDLNIPKQTFGYTRQIHSSQSQTSPPPYSFAAVAGLSSCNTGNDASGSLTSLIESLSNGGHIQSPGFSLSMNPQTSRGQLLLGAVDSSKYTAPLCLFDLPHPNSWYSIYLSKISSSSVSSEGLPQIEVLFDTSSDSIVLPSSWSSDVSNVFGGQIDENSDLLIPCTACSIESNVDFLLGNGLTISIPISSFVGSVSGTDGMCQSPFSFTTGNQFSLGTSFLRYIYLTLNSNATQGSVAQANFDVTQSNLTAITPGNPIPNAILFEIPPNNVASSSALASSTASGSSSHTQAILVATGDVVSHEIISTVTSAGSEVIISTVVFSTLTTTSETTITLTSAQSLSSASVSTNISAFSSTSSVSTTVSSTHPDLLLIFGRTSSSIATSSSSDSTVASTSLSAASAVVSISSVSGSSVLSSSTSNSLISRTAETDLVSGSKSSSIVVTSSTIVTSSTAGTLSTSTSSTTSRAIAGAVNLVALSGTSTPLSSSSLTPTSSSLSGTLSSTTDPSFTAPISTPLSLASGSNSILSTSISGIVGSNSISQARNTDAFDVPVTSSHLLDATSTLSQPSDPVNVNIFIQNFITLTTTHRYAPTTDDNVVTITTTDTVTTTVGCSTDPTITETVTAEIIQVLIVPSPTPYWDDDCTCTKSDITYVDQQSVTKTVYVTPTSVIILPTAHPKPTTCETDIIVPTEQPVPTTCETATILPTSCETATILPTQHPEPTSCETDIIWPTEQPTPTTCDTATIWPTQQPVQSSCECPDCYYTVKKTCTITETCTATVLPTTALPTWTNSGRRTVETCPLLLLLVLGTLVLVL